MKATHYHAGMHVVESELLPAVRACPICSASGPRTRVLRLQLNPEVLLLHCPQCGSYSASRMPSEDTLRRYYAHYYENSGRISTFKAPDSFARHILGGAGNLRGKQSPAILDFGGGGGNLSRAVAGLLLRDGAARVSIDPVDYNSGLSRSDSQEICIRAHQTLETVTRGGFDLVLASAILEHIPEPWPIITRLSPRWAPALCCTRVRRRWHICSDCSIDSGCTTTSLFRHTSTTWGRISGSAFWNGLPASCGKFRLMSSRPSIVETSFRADPLRTAMAHALKSPWYARPVSCSTA